VTFFIKELTMNAFIPDGRMRICRLVTAIAALCCFVASCPIARAAEGSSPASPLTVAEQISQKRTFRQQLLWVGTLAPSEADSQALLTALETFRTTGNEAGIAALEGFLISRPRSPWGPSLHSQLGAYYRQAGKYSMALTHWETAWKATSEFTSGSGKAVADFTLANWSALLSSLGRIEALDEIMEATRGRILGDVGLRQMFNQSRQALAIMKRNPGVSYKCGTFALSQIADLLPESRRSVPKILEIPSPASGFSMTFLGELSGRFKLGLVPVQRTEGDELVVPSVVHWRQNHYAAILSKTNQVYKVVDPTFGRPKWMTAEAINAEATGYFMVSTNLKPDAWKVLAKSETDGIFGKGMDTSPPHPQQPPCPEEGMPECESCRAGGFGGGAGGGAGGHAGAPSRGGGSPCGTCRPPPLFLGIGMPVWEVAEPYISLWLRDQPMAYQPSIGSEIAFKLYFHQRETRVPDANAFSFGPNWNCNWLTFAEVVDQDGSDTNFNSYEAILYGSGGGERSYSSTDAGPEYYSHTSFQRILSGTNLTGFKVLYPGGAQAIYGLLWKIGDAPPTVRAFLTERKDAQGRTILSLQYDANSSRVLLTNIVDAESRSTVLRYGTNFTTQIAEVESPFQQIVKIAYNTNGMLASIVDAIGLTNSLGYEVDGISGLSYLTNLHTPYGDTAFNYVVGRDAPLFDNTDDDDINRAILVTEPGGTARHLFVYRDDSRSLFRNEEYIDFLPQNYSSGFPEDLALDGEPGDGLSNDNMFFRNSFYWGPRQLAAITNTVLQLTVDDYRLARLHHWLHAKSLSLFMVSSTLNMERAPSADGTNDGFMLWYGYAGKTSDFYEGTNAKPSCIAYLHPTTGETHYTYMEYDPAGNMTLEAESYSGPSGPLSRTNTFIYSTNGVDLISHVDPSGHTVMSNIFNAAHQVMVSYNALNEMTTFDYDSSQRLTNHFRPSGLNIAYIYGTNGYLQKVIEKEISRTNSFVYTNALLFTHTDERGLTVTNFWDALNRPTGRAWSDVFGNTVTTSNLYNKLDLVGIKDPLDNWTGYGFDALRHMTSMTNALTNIWLYTWCDCGSLETIADPLTNITTFYYDLKGRLTNTYHPDGARSIQVYNLLDQVERSGDAGGNWTTNYYNNQGLLCTVSNAFGQMMKTSFDNEDHATNAVSANGVVANTRFDELGRLLTRWTPGAGTNSYGYSARGLVSQTNELGKITRYAYNEAGRKVAETNANNELVQFQYDSSGSLTNLIDGKNNSTKWQYDQFGRVTNKLDALGSNIFRYAYDPAGQLTNRWTPAKGNTIYRYDLVGSLTNVDYATSPDISMAYDALKRLTNMVDAVGTTRHAYSTTHLESEDGPWDSDTVSYAYNYLGLRETLSVARPSAAAWAQTNTYDSGHRLYQIAAPEGTYTYLYLPIAAGVTGASSLLGRLSLPNTAYITNTFDDLGRLTGTYLKNSGNTILNKHVYGYNGGNQRTAVTNTMGNFVNYAYDSIGQLTNAVGKESGGVTNRLFEQFAYGYDAAGNLSSRTNNALVQTFNTDSLNQLTTVGRSGTFTVAGFTTLPATNVTVNGASVNVYADNTFARDGVTLADGANDFTAIARDAYGRSDTNTVSTWIPATASFTHDFNGNLLSDGHRAFAYDDENQLISVIITNSTKSVFTYDGKMRRRVRTEFVWFGGEWVTNEVVRYVYDGNLAVQERNGSNAPLITYTRGNDLTGSLDGAGGIGGLLARTAHTSATTAFYHADGNGNVTAMTDSQQSTVARYTYDPYGNTLSASGSLAAGNLYRFSSKKLHLASGLVYYGYRFYVPELQRWVNRDPFFNELNTAFPGNAMLQKNEVMTSEVLVLYGFCFNNPANTFDTDGLWAPIPIVTAGLSIGFCLIGVYELAEYFKCMQRSWELSRQAREKLPIEKYTEWCRKNRGQECTELFKDAGVLGLKCAFWGAGRVLLIKAGINPILGGKIGAR
jgi:RHS repeat-associated protein